MTKTNSIYRQKDCLNLCQTDYLIKKCNLSSQLGFTWEFDRNENNDCQMNETENFFSKDINEYCAPFCPMECDSMSYLIVPHYEAVPSIGIISAKKKSESGYINFNTYEEMNKNN